MRNRRMREELVEAMGALHEAGVVSGATMRTFEKDLLGSPPKFSAKRVHRLRERFAVSQGVFAALLNVSLSTLQKWEQGQKVPSSAATRLLQVVDEHGLGILVPHGTLDK